ncbi:MAG: hypothetical protein ACTS3F_00295 [Phycisphaerales bacterium]
MGARGFWDRFRGETAGERARRIHQSWLSMAMRGEIGPFPRIPTRRVSDGGWDGLMRTEDGRRWARRWWHRAFRTMDERSRMD